MVGQEVLNATSVAKWVILPVTVPVLQASHTGVVEETSVVVDMVAVVVEDPPRPATLAEDMVS